MKTFIYLLTIACMIAACKKMDDNYKDFLEPGGITYPGKALSPKVHPGNNRAKISWLRGPDPKVVKARIFWNNFSDSVELNIGPKEDTVSYTFTNLAENDYTFNIRTYDEKGHVSIPVEVSGSVFGTKYQARLLNRAINASTLEADGRMIIEWGAADTVSGAFATEVMYTNVNGNTITERYTATVTNSILPDYKSGTSYSFRTLFLPDSLAIDTFHTAYQETTPAAKIDRSTWTVTANSFEPTGQQPNGAPEKVLDGNANTYWHSIHSRSPLPGYPHWLAFDMKRAIKVTRVELTSRPDYYREDFTEFSIQGSDDGNTWRTYGSFTLPDVVGPQSFNISGTPVTRYIRLYMTKGVSVHAHLAEFAVYGVPQ